MEQIKESFKRGLRLGTLRKYLKKHERFNKHLSKLVYSDLKYANPQLIDYVLNIENKTFEGVIAGVQVWLDMHSKITGFERIKYLIGDGENIFKIVEIEEELYRRNKKKLKKVCRN